MLKIGSHPGSVEHPGTVDLRLDRATLVVIHNALNEAIHLPITDEAFADRMGYKRVIVQVMRDFFGKLLESEDQLRKHVQGK